jgi:hypothetical protein
MQAATQDLAPALSPGRPQPMSAAADTDQARAIAEVQGQMILAKKFPRDEIRARDKIINSCMRKGLAEVSQFSFSRGGSEVTGPSIDLLTVVAAHWGNILHSWRELSRTNGASEIEAFAWDMESNTKVSRTLAVKHIRDTKKGPKVVTEERDINELCANWASRWVRTCLEKIIPPDIIDDAVAQCNATLNSNAEVTPERIKNMIAQFSEFSITKEMIEGRLQRRVDSMTPSQLVSISRIYKSMKDGMSKPEDWFDMSAGKKDVVEAKTDDVGAEKQKVAEKKKTEKAASKPIETDDPATGEVTERSAEHKKPAPAADASSLQFAE